MKYWMGNMNNKPAGISFIAIVFLALGVLSLIWSALVLGWGSLSSIFGVLFGGKQAISYGSSTAWSGFLGLITALVQIVVGFGLFGMKKWAWALALLGVGLTVAEGVVGIFSGGVFAFICGSIGLLFPVIFLIYLLRPPVRDAFT